MPLFNKDVVEVVKSLLDRIDSTGTNVVKKKRARTQEQMKKNNALKHPILPTCKCKNSCYTLFDNERRNAIHDEFWSLDHDRQMAWVVASVDNVTPVRPRSNTEEKRVCSSTKKYHLINSSGDRKKVCAIMYRHTLGYKYDTFLKVIFSKVSHTKVLPSPDKRGRHEPSNKLNAGQIKTIRDHIMSFNPTISHYRRKHAPNRLYLSPELTIKSMWSDYIDKFTPNKVSYSTYHNVLESLNISFARLGLEDCEDCIIHKQHFKDAHSDGAIGENCEQCIRFADHKAKTEEVRAEYKKDVALSESSECDVSFFSSDMQKVVMLPRIPGSKQCIFTKRMVAFHQTFAPIRSFAKTKPIGIIWNESIAGRKAVDLASVYVTFIRKIQTEQKSNEIMIWADNCSGQNKNWWLLTALVAEVNRKNGPKLIGLKFFEPGHTFMSADAFHSVVEQIMKRKKNIYDFDEFSSVINSRGVALEIQYFDFIQYPRGVSNGKYTKDKPYLENIREVQFRKGSQKMFWRESFKEEFKSAIFLQKKVSDQIIKGKDFPSAPAPRGILSSKKQDLVEKLCPLMGSSKNRAYWSNLPESEIVVDLADTREDGEYVYKD